MHPAKEVLQPAHFSPSSSSPSSSFSGGCSPVVPSSNFFVSFRSFSGSNSSAGLGFVRSFSFWSMNKYNGFSETPAFWLKFCSSKINSLVVNYKVNAKKFSSLFFRSFLVLIKNLGQKSNGGGRTMFSMTETPQRLPLPLTRVRKNEKGKSGKHVGLIFINSFAQWESMS